jgi:hypothetical protein
MRFSQQLDFLAFGALVFNCFNKIRVEAGSNTATGALRVVDVDEKGTQFPGV